MNKKKAIIIYGGWEGHQPKQIALFLKRIMEKNDIETMISDDPEILSNSKYIKEIDLLVTQWTDGTLSDKQLQTVIRLVGEGCGLAGIHSGLCCSFNSSIDWSFMTGAMFTGHPGGEEIKYKVKIEEKENIISAGVDDFEICTEQYYMLIDPAVNIIASSVFPKSKTSDTDNFLELDNGGHGSWNSSYKAYNSGPHIPNMPVKMPVAWTKLFGAGRIFGCTLGHSTDIAEMKPVKTLISNGIKWGAKII